MSGEFFEELQKAEEFMNTVYFDKISVGHYKEIKTIRSLIKNEKEVFKTISGWDKKRSKKQ